MLARRRIHAAMAMAFAEQDYSRPEYEDEMIAGRWPTPPPNGIVDHRWSGKRRRHRRASPISM